MAYRHIALFLSRVRAAWADLRGAAALEFAIIAIPFILTLLFTLEVAYDLFVQEALDSALHLAARQIQTGNAQNLPNGAAFVSQYICPAAAGQLDCNNIYFSVHKLNLVYPQDYWNVTTGLVPMTAGALDLSQFGSSSFCNTGPSELLLMQAIYISPTLVGTMIPSMSLVFGGSRVHATLSQVGTVTENYAATPLSTGSASAC